MKKLIATVLILALTASGSFTSASAAGRWVQEDNTWHVYQDDQIVKKDWYQDNGKWYYLDNHGEITTGWIFIDHIWYYMDGNGVMKTGWQEIDDTWYYFRENGQMFKGWLQTKSGAPWYYLNSSGKMVVGWQQVDGKWYYFDNTGKMFANTTVDGYKLGADGAMIDENNTSSENSSNSSPSEENIPQTDDERRAYQAAGQALAYFRKQLKNPDSLIPKMISSTVYDNGLVAVFATISGMNSLGGYSSDTFIVYVYENKVYEVYDCAPIQNKVDQAHSTKGNLISLDCDKALTYEP